MLLLRGFFTLGSSSLGKIHLKPCDHKTHSAESAFGPLDVMVANAGIALEYESYTVNENESLVDHPTEDYRRILSVNQDGVYFSIKYGGRSMVRMRLEVGYEGREGG